MPKQGSKSGKSSKTARVLNLLTDPESVEKPDDKQDTAGSAAETGKLADDRRTQAKIRGALEEELANMPAPRPKRSRSAPKQEEPKEDAPESAPAPEAAPAAEPERAGQPASPSEPEAEIELEPLPMPVVQTATVTGETEPMPEPVFSVPSQETSPLQAAFDQLRSAGEKDPDEYICYNITQTLVEDKADKYIKMFHLCSCKRCRIDVIALALSNLPPKYVVARPHELIPRLSMYEQKYNAAVVTQVMSACKKVLDRPHHNRDEK